VEDNMEEEWKKTDLLSARLPDVEYRRWAFCLIRWRDGGMDEEMEEQHARMEI